MHDRTSQFFDLQSFMKIALALRRVEYLDADFWRIFFNVLPDLCAAEKGASYEHHFTLRSIDLFAKDPASKEEYKEVSELLHGFEKQHPKLYADIMNANLKELAKSLPESTQEMVSGLQHQVRLYLEALNIKYEEEAVAGFAMVDFILTEKKLILELQGPAHFLKPKLNEMNLVTKFKIKCLEKLGYKVIIVPFNAVSTDHMSLDNFLLQHIKDQ